MNYGPCVLCDSTVYESDEQVSLSFGVAHFECHEEGQRENEAGRLRHEAEVSKQIKNDKRILKHLERTLKPKVWENIKFAMYGHRYQDLAIVGFDKVGGAKQSAMEWFGESVAIRHVFDDISSCSLSDTYGGSIWLPIGHARYLHMHIWG
jgi:hypothetical protein